ncbi:MAG TPA: DUF4129 domain-containing protein [Gaiellaceae bacterium]|nr:DUF4129 domain-containing protein [Gaiellaceae bacterium]
MAVALVVLLGIVALASRDGVGHASTSRPTPAYVSWALSVFLVVFVLMIPVALWALFNQERMEKRAAVAFQSRVLRSFAVLAVVLAAVVGWSYLRRHGRLPDLQQLFAPAGDGGGGGGGGHARPYTPTFQWPVLWATIGLLAACAVAAWWSYRRRPALVPAGPAGANVADELAATISDAIDDLEAEPDARRAVIAAYARMEGVLERSGVRRAPSETALEYLRRVLLELTANGDSVARLTSLFERAKFSSHDIDAPMKREAISALRALRDDLRPAPA